jgi:hypothetical protein
LASKHSLHAVTDFVRGDGKVSGALGSIALKITKALGTICNLHAIHRHPKERTPVSVAEDLDEMVKAGLISLWDGGHAIHMQPLVRSLVSGFVRFSTAVE